MYPFLMFAQTVEPIGVKFEKRLSWEEIKDLARKEHKFIFLDCYTTWCGPCKAMDAKVYTDGLVANELNKNFVCAKVQMDVTAKDEESIKLWYDNARDLIARYHIEAYPSYLFFDSEGSPLHKGIGYLPKERFLELIHNAIDSDFQYYTLIDKYKNHRLPYGEFPHLIAFANSINETGQAAMMSNEYINDYLFGLGDTAIYQKPNLDFIIRSPISVHSLAFSFIQKNTAAIDSILKPNVAERKLISVISYSEINPLIEHLKSEYEWELLQKKLMRKYGKFGSLAVLQRRLGYFYDNKDWKNVSKSFWLYYKDIGNLNIYNTNNFAWMIFENCTEIKELAYAIKVMNLHKEDDAESMDTYANLLYKSGKIDLAILYEGMAISMNEKRPENMKNNTNYFEIKKKMMEGIPTWSKF